MPTSSVIAGQNPAGSPTRAPDLFPFRGLAQRLQPIDRIRDLYNRAQQPVNRSLLENLLSEMRVEYEVSDLDIARIPASGPVLVVANHPFGVLDGTILGALLQSVRPDAKIMTNALLSGISELHEYCIFVDSFLSAQSFARNQRALKKAIAWLREGGVVAMFPAGEVSHLRLPHMQVADPEWAPTAARLARITNTPVLPVYFCGRNSVAFQALGLVHPSLRTALLLTEFLQQTDKKVQVRIGSIIPADTVQDLDEHHEASHYLRWRTYLLAERSHSRPQFPSMLRSVLRPTAQKPLATAVPQAALLEDIVKLRPDQCFGESRELCVYIAAAWEIPNLIQELGRVRELTFRAAGEGTGKGRDLDRFDHYYKHVLLWSRVNCELVGAYRIGHTTDILPRMGMGGLYTSTLFRYDARLFDRLGPALELGRSFIRPEYQRQYAPLLMLWKGIGRYLALHVELAVLFGAVSISSRYNRASRDLIFRFFQSREEKHELASLIRPRCAFRSSWIRPKSQGPICGMLRDLDRLADPIADLESDGKGLPILLKQYAKLGGRLLSFNVDRSFSDVLDGLVLVDLRKTDPALLERYMGREGIRTFRRYHGLPTVGVR